VGYFDLVGSLGLKAWQADANLSPCE